MAFKASTQKRHRLPSTFHGPKEVTWLNPNLAGKILVPRRGTASLLAKLNLSIARIYNCSREKRTVNSNILCPTACIIFWKVKIS